MKFYSAKKPSRATGSVLMITLIIALLLGLVLTSYLMLIRAQNVSVVRSQAWHSALSAAESGVEEALAQLNSPLFATSSTVINGWSSSNNLTSDNYQPYYYSVSYVAPTIYATGYARVPALSATLARAVKVAFEKVPLFTGVAATPGRINMNGKTIFTDSFDSTSNYLSTGGKYDKDKIDSHGDIATDGGFTNSGNADIKGKLSLGVFATNTASPGFKVSEEIARDFNEEFSDVSPPFLQNPIAPPAQSNYTYYLQGNNYQINKLSGSVCVAPKAHAVLYVTGNANVTDLLISPGASLKLYVGGANATFEQNIVSGSPANFQYYGLPGNTSITLKDYDLFTGTIYAPNAVFHAGEKAAPGEVFLDVDFYGALVTKAIEMHSDLRLHFDKSLKNVTGSASAQLPPVWGFRVVRGSWQELPVATAP